MKHLFLIVAFCLCAEGISGNGVTRADLPLPPPATEESCSAIQNESDRLDCYPDAGASEKGCIERGCCWSQIAEGRPWCYYPKGFVAYQVSPDNMTLHRIYRSPFPDDIVNVRLEISDNIENVILVKLSDADKSRFVPPFPALNRPQRSSSQNPLRVSRNNNDKLLEIKRMDSERARVGIDSSNILFADQFLQVTLDIGGKSLYGIGEHRASLALSDNWTKFSLWNRDTGPRPETNLYGSHPFFFTIDENGNSLGFYFHNSAAMEFLIQPGPRVTFRSIGGIIELYVFAGPKPIDVIKQYNSLIGLPMLPPYWSLGFQLCRWGYGSSDNTRAVWQKMRDAKIPFDVQWNDIDYMETQNDFTIDAVNFAGLPQLVDDIHAAGMHYVSMLDPGISGSQPAGTYPPYTDAVAMDVLVKDDAGNIFVGAVWNPNSTVYPDFTHPRALEYWQKQLQEFHDKISYDALWIDMNEPSNFIDGSVGVGCPDNNIENPPYLPNVDGGALKTKTLCLTARHHAGRHYYIHNLYSISEANVTLLAAQNILKKRTFIISRATFAGQGRYSGHWSGDNYSDWNEMIASIYELINFNFYGIPFMGADICGFGNEPSRELCLRWHQLGAFYTFSRNHNTIGTKDQDPASFDDDFAEATRKVLGMRYLLLPYLYTLLYRASVAGEPVARPLVLEFPEDLNTHTIDKAFLWGRGLYIIPVLEEGATTVEAYLPSARWFNLYNGKELEGAGTTVTLDAPLDTIPLLLRGGVVFPTQESAVTTTLSRKNSFALVVVPDENGNASGNLFWDDGDSLGTVEGNRYGLVDFKLSSQIFTSSVAQWNTEDTPTVGYIHIYGVNSASSVTVNGNSSATFDLTANKVLLVDINDIPLNKAITLTWNS